MNENYEIKNAVIESAIFDVERVLSAWFQLDYGDSEHQGFGGYLLYVPEGLKAHNSNGSYAGHFIWRVLEIAGVDDWARLPGRMIRVKANRSNVAAIGHIIKDDWFDPTKDFEAMLANREGK